MQLMVIRLWEENQILNAQVSQLQTQVGELQGEVKRLNERLDMNSQNSSKHPPAIRRERKSILKQS